MRLGESENFKVTPSKSVPYEDGDTLFLYSDGLIDLKNADGEELGKTRLKEELLALARDEKSLMSMRERIRLLAKDHSPEELPEDDITFAFVRLKS
jgi:serine phosphatase RsbU (regulator of sigma subunit)